MLGDDRSHVFTVEIVGNKNISTLKELIKDKKKHAFGDIDADVLKLLKVRALVDFYAGRS